jgi:N-acetylneuraminic acid mutarotase
MSTNRPPVANAGGDVNVISCSSRDLLNSTSGLDGSGSTDPDNNIVSYQWKRISGPPLPAFSPVNVPGSATQLSVINLQPGSAMFELIVTDAGGLFSKDTAQVTILENHQPIADAGAVPTITLPTNTVNLNGSGSTDPENNIGNYEWTKISGPSSFNIVNPSAVQTQVTNLVAGTYQFELKVRDRCGLFSTDMVQIIVNPELTQSPNCDISNRPVGNVTLTFYGQLPEPRYGITVATVGNKIFIAGGFASYSGVNTPANFSNRVDIYDITTGQWTSTQLSEPRAYCATAVLGNKIFFAGGFNSNGLRTTVDIYDISSNTWSITQLSQAREGIAGGVINNKVFFAGGIIDISIGGGYGTRQLLDRVDIYDAATNSWSTTTLSEPRYCINDLEKITVTVVGTKIFFSGGSCNTILDCSSNRIDMYDAATNTWSNENYLAQNAGSLFVGIATGNKNYRVTGEYWPGGKIVEIRDEITHTTSYECLSATLYKPPVSNGNKLIFPVSTISQYTAGHKLTHFDVYDLSTNTWSISKLPQSGVDLSWVISVNNEVYVLGGSSTTNGFIYEKLYKLAF